MNPRGAFGLDISAWVASKPRSTLRGFAAPETIDVGTSGRIDLGRYGRRRV